MPVKAWNGTAWAVKPAKAWNGAAWAAKPVKAWSGTAWVRVDAVLAATASPDSVVGSTGNSFATTGTTSVTVTGATGALSYSWRHVTGDGGFNALQANSATTDFGGSLLFSGETKSADFVCDVTDAGTGQTVMTNIVNATINRI